MEVLLGVTVRGDDSSPLFRSYASWSSSHLLSPHGHATVVRSLSSSLAPPLRAWQGLGCLQTPAYRCLLLPYHPYRTAIRRRRVLLFFDRPPSLPRRPSRPTRETVSESCALACFARLHPTGGRHRWFRERFFSVRHHRRCRRSPHTMVRREGAQVVGFCLLRVSLFFVFCFFFAIFCPCFGGSCIMSLRACRCPTPAVGVLSYPSSPKFFFDTVSVTDSRRTLTLSYLLPSQACCWV